MTITMIPTVPSAWDRIKGLGAERASWHAPVLHLQCDFDTDTVYGSDHNDGVLKVNFGAMRHFLYVASTFERALEVCLWDLQQKQQVLYVAVNAWSKGSLYSITNSDDFYAKNSGDFFFARYPFTARWHHVSVVKPNEPVYRAFTVRAEFADDELMEFIVRQMF